MAGIAFSCLLTPCCCGISPLGCSPRHRLLVLLLLFTQLSSCRGPTGGSYGWGSGGEGLRSTSTCPWPSPLQSPWKPRTSSIQALSYSIMVDCGSSGSWFFSYYWLPHNENPPHMLLVIWQMKVQDHKPVVKKIKPGISTLASFPSQASDHFNLLLRFAAAHVANKNKHKEMPRYILNTADTRLLPERQWEAILTARPPTSPESLTSCSPVRISRSSPGSRHVSMPGSLSTFLCVASTTRTGRPP